MKPGIPWSVKGIEPEAREAAKLAARRAGLTLGEWLNSVIFDQSAHILPGQADSHHWENFVSSPPPPFEPPRPEPPPAPLSAKAAAPERRDESAMRLQDIAQQLADLAQRERQSAPPPPYGRPRPDDRDEFERILERLNDNERQTVDALSAVNERLSTLARQVSQLGRAPSFERPEDVPGYPALEAAIRSVVEHIEVSEKRTRDSLKSMQDRLAEVSERNSGAPSGEDILRAAPILSGLEGRLADMVNRIQRSEGLMTERIEGVRANAQQMANQAQSSAVTALRGELREVETRMLASLKEAQAAAASVPSMVASEIAKLHGDVAGLSRRLDDVKAGAASDRDLQSLRSAMEQLSARVAQGPDMRPLADMDKRLGDINRRLEQAAAVTREEPRAGALEQRIAELDHRLADAMRLQGDQQALARLEESIASVNQRVAQTEQQLSHLETMEQAIRQLYDSLEQTRSSVSDAAEDAATRALERYQPTPSPAQPSVELKALEDGLRAVRESAVASERRHQDTFEAVHETLAEIVDKLSQLETGERPVRVSGISANRAAREPEPLRAEHMSDDVSQQEPPPHQAQPQPETSSAQDPVPDSTPEPSTQEPLTGADDFIAAARRAAQAAATRPSALRAEYATLTQPVEEQKPARLSLLQRLRGRRRDPEPGSDPASSSSKSGRRTLILAGLMLLMAASAVAYRNLGAPAVPALQQSNTFTVPKQALPPVAASNSSDAADPIATGSLPQVVAEPVATSIDMPPPDLGTKALRKAAAGGDSRAQFIIAGRYLEGQGTGQDFARALYWYQQAATRGLAPAQYRLATLYELGKGVAADPVRALSWYERAALGGNVRAMHNAAVLAAGDKAGPPDFDRAFRWFSAAAERGFADSQFNLAILYERGLGTPRSLEHAYVWYSLAAKQGDPDSLERANTLARKLSESQLKAAKASLASWVATPSDDSANVVTVVDPAWQDGKPGVADGQSS